MPFPFAGWYNGNPDLMIKNGTYADFREFLLTHRYITAEQAKRFDAEWETVSPEDRARRRSVVVDDMTKKMRPALDGSGRMVLRAEPDRNNNEAPYRKIKRNPPPAKGRVALYEEAGIEVPQFKYRQPLEMRTSPGGDPLAPSGLLRDDIDTAHESPRRGRPPKNPVLVAAPA